jgi:hypothetical protein
MYDKYISYASFREKNHVVFYVDPYLYILSIFLKRSLRFCNYLCTRNLNSVKT